MKVAGKHHRTLWLADDRGSVAIIDQTALPHQVSILVIESVEAMAEAIAQMRVRGAPLIGIAACYGFCLAMRRDSSDDSLKAAAVLLRKTRPTAVNLQRRIDEMLRSLTPLSPDLRTARAYALAENATNVELDAARRIGEHGCRLIRERWESRRRRSAVNVLTHCNAGWLATIDWGTALAPVYRAHQDGIPVHVWVDETRPRNQGCLTAWELSEQGVPNTLIVDNVGGHLMQHQKVDLCIVGTDRTTATGDVCNKIGTYLKALAARDNQVPFYAAVPQSSIDWSIRDGLEDIPIEERSAREVHEVLGVTSGGEPTSVRVTAPTTVAANYGFDVTPARLVSGLITERGVCMASVEGLLGLFPERRDEILPSPSRSP